MFRETISRAKANWCGSIATGQSSHWPPLRGSLCTRGFPPDGRRAAVAITEQDAQVWLYDLRENWTRLTFGGNNTLFPAWTPDGKRIAFSSDKDGPNNLFWQLPDGRGGLE